MASPASTQSNPGPDPKSSRKCFDFNFKGTCQKHKCTYLHACLNCGGPHQQFQCFKPRLHHNNFRAHSAQYTQSSATQGMQRHVMPQESPTPLGLWDLGHTPINCSVLKTCLSSYPNKEAATELGNCFCYGFKLKYTGSRQSSMLNNLKSALEYPQVIQEKVLKEVSLGRIFGPFKTSPLANLKIIPHWCGPKGRWGLASNYTFVISFRF